MDFDGDFLEKEIAPMNHRIIVKTFYFSIVDTLVQHSLNLQAPVKHFHVLMNLH